MGAAVAILFAPTNRPKAEDTQHAGEEQRATLGHEHARSHFLRPGDELLRAHRFIAHGLGDGVANDRHQIAAAVVHHDRLGGGLALGVLDADDAAQFLELGLLDTDQLLDRRGLGSIARVLLQQAGVGRFDLGSCLPIRRQVARLAGDDVATLAGLSVQCLDKRLAPEDEPIGAQLALTVESVRPDVNECRAEKRRGQQQAGDDDACSGELFGAAGVGHRKT